MRVLVTGATGFVGSYVIEELLKNSNTEIIATSTNKQKAQQKEWYDKVTYIEYDLASSQDNIYELFHKPDRLIHLAWDGLPNYDNQIHITNLFNNYKFIQELIGSGLKDINCIGTCFEYGMQNGQLREDTDTKPNTTYGFAKDTLHKMILELKKHYTFDLKWIRLFYMYGEGQSPKSLFSQLDNAIRDNQEIFNMSMGEQLRDYLHISDIAKYIVAISLQNNVLDSINCGSGIAISIRRLVQDYITSKNSNIKLNLGYYNYATYEPMAFWADVTKLNQIIKGK